MAAEAPQVTHRLAFRDIAYTVKVKKRDKVILHDIGATVESGRVLAIMGPSGAGKTSLLNVLTLTAFGGRSEGSVQLNGADMTLQKFQRCCALVTQNNFHWSYLTPRETLNFAADLYLDASADEKRERVETLLSSLGLTGCADTVVGNQFKAGLSGGQSRRLSIALALIKRPTVLFLDEPTSGLDAAAAVGVMDCIRELAKSSNLVVICTIHQPSTVVYNSFDQVMLLAGGAVAFRGTADEAVPYFASIGHAMPNHSNPAEFMLNLVNDEFSDPKQVAAVMQQWATRSAGADAGAEPAFDAEARSVTDGMHGNPTTFATQTSTLLRRHFKLTLRDPAIYLGRLVCFLMACTFFSVIYVKARERSQEYALQRVWLMMWFTGVPSSMGVIVVHVLNEEFKAVRKEWRNGMVSGAAYLLARTLIEIPMMIVLGLAALSVAGYGVMGFHGPNFLLMLAMWSIVMWSMEAMAQVYSVQFENPLLGMLSFMNLWFGAFLFSGLLIAERDVIWPFRLFCYILPLKWGLRAMIYIEYSDVTFDGAITAPCPANYSAVPTLKPECTYHPKLGQTAGFTCPDIAAQQGCFGYTGPQVLESIGQNFDVVSSENTLQEDFLILAGIGIVCKISYFALVMMRLRKASAVSKPKLTGGSKKSTAVAAQATDLEANPEAVSPVAKAQTTDI